MTTYFTNNPLGSNSPYDLFDNAQNFDLAINNITAAFWQDRFGRKRNTWSGVEQMATKAIAAFGYITIDSFQEGATLSLPNQILRDTSTGEYYRWDGLFPKVVPTGSTPDSTGGVSIGAWLSVGDASLRSDVRNAMNNDIYSNHQRKIAFQFPLLFSDYDSVLSENPGVSYIYPQSFCFADNKIFIVYNAEPKQANNVIVVYDNSSNYLGYYYVDNGGVGVASEGIVVTSDYGDLHLFIGSSAGIIKEYKITGVSYGDLLVAVSEHSVGVYNQFGYRNGNWIVEQNTPELGQSITRTVLSVYDRDFKRSGTLTFPLHDCGYITATTSEYSQYFNKRQGIAVGDNYIAFGYGGYFADAGLVQTPNLYQGTKIFNSDGTKRTESILKPQQMIDALKDVGMNVTRIENEGVAVSEDGSKLYSMFIHNERLSSISHDTGIVIFEEYSNDSDAIDFRDASTIYLGYNVDHASIGTFPRSFDGIVNPITGEVFTSLTQILTYMKLANQKAFSFYTSTVSINDISGNAIPSSTLVSIMNANNMTFTVTYTSPEGGIRYVIGVSPTTDTYVFIRQREALWANVLTLAQSSDGSDQFNRIIAASKTGTSTNADKVLVIDQQSNANGNGLVIGGGSGTFKSATQIDFATNPTGTSLGGTVRMRIADYGVRPYADNTYTFGQSAYRWTTGFFASGISTTSDQRLKTDVLELSAAEKCVATELKGLIRRYKFTESVAEKGESARYHFGVIAQQVKETFEAHGLIAEDYGILCHDTWGNEYEPVIGTREIVNDQGEATLEDYDTGATRLVLAAGDRYSIRYDELLCFIIAAI